MNPNWTLISEILVTLRIYDKEYVISSENFPDYCSEELKENLSFLKEIGLVDTSVDCSDKEHGVSHILTSDGEKIIEKIMPSYYAELM